MYTPPTSSTGQPVDLRIRHGSQVRVKRDNVYLHKDVKPGMEGEVIAMRDDTEGEDRGRKYLVKLSGRSWPCSFSYYQVEYVV